MKLVYRPAMPGDCLRHPRCWPLRALCRLQVLPLLTKQAVQKHFLQNHTGVASETGVFQHANFFAALSTVLCLREADEAAPLLVFACRRRRGKKKQSNGEHPQKHGKCEHTQKHGKSEHSQKHGKGEHPQQQEQQQQLQKQKMVTNATSTVVSGNNGASSSSSSCCCGP